MLNIRIVVECATTYVGNQPAAEAQILVWVRATWVLSLVQVMLFLGGVCPSDFVLEPMFLVQVRGREILIWVVRLNPSTQGLWYGKSGRRKEQWTMY